MNDTITTERLLLRPLTTADAPELLALLQANREFLTPWQPTMPDGVFTLAAVEQDIQARNQAWQEERGYGFGIIHRATGALIGRINLSQVFRGVFHNCFLGYWLAESFNGQGLTTEAVVAIVRWAFTDLELHRVEATTLVQNVASQQVLRKAGFRREGLALNYLQINGRWQDHYIHAITAEELDQG